MSRPIKALAIAATIMVLGAATVFAGSSKSWSFGAKLIGYEEVPAVSTQGSGSFKATVAADGLSYSFVLTYTGLEGDVTQSHTHFGQKGVNGGISVFYCSNLGNGPAGTPACPPSPATITGTRTAADVIGPNAQGISAGEWAELIAAIKAGVTYTNVHSTTWPGGEIRGQLNLSRNEDEQ